MEGLKALTSEAPVRTYAHWQYSLRTAVGTAAVLLVIGAAPVAQQAPVHLNPVIAKLAAGQSVFGISNQSLSMDTARAMSRAPVDFVRLEMEHAPMDFTALRDYLVGTIDKQAAIQKGNAQMSVATFARFLPYGRENVNWTTKQALDLGLMGVAFSTIDNKEQATRAVQGMRYPQRRESRYPQPAGLRGQGQSWASWIWGTNDYGSRADVWPLNPNGDLLAIIMIESVEGLKNIEEIASVPGVGVLWPGAFSDLASSMGVSNDSPEVETASQTILKACLKYKVVCGLNPRNDADLVRRIKEGWRYFDLGDAGSLSTRTEGMLKTGRAAK